MRMVRGILGVAIVFAAGNMVPRSENAEAAQKGAKVSKELRREEVGRSSSVKGCYTAGCPSLADFCVHVACGENSALISIPLDENDAPYARLEDVWRSGIDERKIVKCVAPYGARNQGARSWRIYLDISKSGVVVMTEAKVNSGFEQPEGECESALKECFHGAFDQSKAKWRGEPVETKVRLRVSLPKVRQF